MRSRATAWLAAFGLACTSASPQAPPPAATTMSFFVTSVNPGNGANLGGVAGADAHCQKLAAAAGADSRAWRAYLSASAAGGRKAVHARDRIGKGPWVNAKGVTIAASLAELHGPGNRIALLNALTEKGGTVPRDHHDILTGSNADGTLATSEPDTTCRNWTSGTIGRAMVGHHDKAGGPSSWSSNHLSEGCSPAALKSSLGAGLLYCFAVN